MSGSPFYKRIERDVLAIVASIPEGRVATFSAIGAHLDVMPRHVAYMLSRPDGPAALLPWHRVVAADGSLVQSARGEAQRALLEAEGFVIDGRGRMIALAEREVAIAALDHGVPAQTRPPDAPSGSPRKRKA